MSNELLEAVKELNETFHQFKAKNDERLAEIEKNGSAPAELDAQVKQMAEDMAKLETKLNRPPVDTTAGDSVEQSGDAHAKAFYAWARKGRDLEPEQRKLLSVGDDTQAGYLAPAQMVAEIIKGAVDFDPIRALCTVRSTTAKELEIPKRTGVAAANWTGEKGSLVETGPTYGMLKIRAENLTAKVPVTFDMLEDSAFNLAQELQAEMAEQFGVAEGVAFLVGDGVDKPQGILTAAGLNERASGNANELTANSIIAMAHAIKPYYRGGAKFLLNDQTLMLIYTLQDGQGQYLYRPNQEVGKAPTIQGYGYVVSPSMPDVAAGTYPILFGDFRRGYTIVDRTQLAVQRDDFSAADNNTVIFRGRKRVGGQVTLAEAMAKLKIAASL